jgi:hypothetical protein
MFTTCRFHRSVAAEAMFVLFLDKKNQKSSNQIGFFYPLGLCTGLGFAFTLQIKQNLGWVFIMAYRSNPLHDENTTCPTVALPGIVLPDFRPKLIC